MLRLFFLSFNLFSFLIWGAASSSTDLYVPSPATVENWRTVRILSKQINECPIRVHKSTPGRYRLVFGRRVFAKVIHPIGHEGCYVHPATGDMVDLHCERKGRPYVRVRNSKGSEVMYGRVPVVGELEAASIDKERKRLLFVMKSHMKGTLLCQLFVVPGNTWLWGFERMYQDAVAQGCDPKEVDVLWCQKQLLGVNTEKEVKKVYGKSSRSGSAV